MPAVVFAIDDNPGDVDLLREAMRETGLTLGVEHAETCEAAIERLESLAADAPPNLPVMVLCDLSLPGESGATVMRFLREHPLLQHVPALLLTGHAPDVAARLGDTTRDRVRQKPKDFDGYLSLAQALRDELPRDA